MTNGAISLAELEKMPIDKYMVIREAAEVEEIRQRLVYISDTSAAFSGSKEHVNKLLKDYNMIMGYQEISFAPADENWKERLMKYKR